MGSGDWYHARGGQHVGPVSLAELTRRVGAGEVGSDDLVWREGMPDWQPVRTVSELAGALPMGPAAAAVRRPSRVGRAIRAELNARRTQSFALHDPDVRFAARARIYKRRRAGIVPRSSTRTKYAAHVLQSIYLRVLARKDTSHEPERTSVV